MNAHEIHCMEFLRQADYDRYLSILYAPEKKRGALASLYAFNAEIARIPHIVHDPILSEIRLQWWRDLINDATYGTVENHPIAAALLETIERYQLPHEIFNRYCEARIFDCYNDPMPDHKELEDYCEETRSALIQLASLILDGKIADRFVKAARHAGIAQGVANLLQFLPLHCNRSQVYVPADLLQEAGANQEILLSGADTDAINRVVAAMVALGQEHFAAFVKEKRDLPSPLRLAYLPVALVPFYLRAVQRVRRTEVTKIVDISPLLRHWILFLAAID